jgi:ADP-ribose pyrophosphatase YjhB (NUDIX family)
MGKLKDQLAGIAALIAAIVAIGGGFVKYGEIVTKLNAIEAREETTVDTSAIESSIAVLEEKVNKLENIDTSHSHDFVEHEHPVDHAHTKPLVNAKEIELLKVQIEEIKVKATNPLAN